jgi:hypothetical protein
MMRKSPILTPLSERALRARRPAPPAALLDALQDRPVVPAKARVAAAVRVPKRAEEEPSVTGYPIVGWGNNKSGPCERCGRPVKAYDSSYQTQDGAKLWHPECVEVKPYYAIYPNLMYYSDF